MRAYIGALDLILFAALVGHDHDLDPPGSAQKRYGVADRPRRRSATVPAYYNVIQPERRLLNVGNDDDRPPGIEQRGFNNILLDHSGLRLYLPDNGQIEAPRDLAELIARADQAGANRQRLSVNTRARACRRETFPNRFDRSFVMPFKHFQFWRNVAGARNRHGRAVKKDDPCQVGV